MIVIDKINKFIKPKNKIISKFKPRCGLSIGVNTMSASGNQTVTAAGSTGFVGTGDTLPAFMPKSLASGFGEIEELYLKNNEDAKDLIVNLNGIITIEDGKANEQYEAIRITYGSLALDLNVLIKIYSFTSGDRTIFAKDSQKNKLLDILSSNNISSINIVDFVSFE